MAFGHLHTHSDYSTLDGMCKIDELVKTAKSLGQEFIALTDHGSTSGLYEFQKACIKHEIKPLLGTEFYYQREQNDGNGHLIAIAKNNTGLKNILQLQEYAYVENFYKKPRINFDILKQHVEGLIVTSACLASSFGQYVINSNIPDAIEWVKKFKELFKEDFYLEIQPNSIPEQLIVNQTAIRIGKQLEVKIIATNDVHYILEQDSLPHEVLLALQTNKKMSDEKRFRFTTDDFWLKSEKEMKDTFIGINPEQISEYLLNTQEIALKANACFTKDNYLPKFYNVPVGQTERSLLVKETIKGVKKYNLSKEKQFMEEVQNEIDVIDRNGYCGYFLIVQDYVTAARSSGNIVGDGRGSGAGSKVAYLVDITRLPPHKYNLLFERFMADGRQPDFDVDFADQDAVFEDLQRKYGTKNVARIIAFGKLTPKNVVRKVLNVFEHPTSELNYVSKLINDAETLDEAYESNTELRAIKDKYRLEFSIIERLEGLISHESQHAGGVIIYPQLSSLLPIKTRGEDRTKRIVGFDKYMLEELGHYKFDILGLETLPVIRRATESIKQLEGLEVDLYSLDYDEQEVYDMLCKGDVSGVFQLANQPGKIIEQQPRNFKDLIAINALIRPGTGDWDEYIARRKGKTWEVIPERLPYLNETEGLITYQEQFLLDAKILANWDIAYADKHIRKNKNIKDDVDLMGKFIYDAQSNGISRADAELVWSEIMDSVAGGYSFNKSHSASYAAISFQTAWLKLHYPAHFYASLMTSEGDNQDAIANYIAECKQRNIQVIPPNINNSGDNFVVINSNSSTDSIIAYRITTIKHVGTAAIKNIEELRPVKNFADFMQRREKRFIKKNVLVNLIKAGCFDFDNPNRAELLWQVDMAYRTKTQIKEDYIPPQYEWSDKMKIEWEKEVLGMYLSSHPMEKYGFEPLSSFIDGRNCLQGGEIQEVKTIIDKNQNEMAFVFVDTLYGKVKVLVFANLWKRKNIKKVLTVNNIVLIRGKKSGDAVLLNEVELLE